MTIKELIAELQTFPEDTRVMIPNEGDCHIYPAKEVLMGPKHDDGEVNYLYLEDLGSDEVLIR